MAKGRNPIIDSITRHKIKRLYSEGVSQESLCQRFGVSPSTISQIVKEDKK